MIFGEINIEYAEGVCNKLGDPLKRYPSTGKKIPIKMKVEELQKLVDVKPGATPKTRLPSITEAQLWDSY